MDVRIILNGYCKMCCHDKPRVTEFDIENQGSYFEESWRISLCDDCLKELYTKANPKVTRTRKPKEPEKPFIPPTEAEMKKFCKNSGYMETVGASAFQWYNNAEPPWTNARGKPVKNWKQTLRQVWFKPEHKEVKKVISNPVRPSTYKKEHEFDI